MTVASLVNRPLLYVLEKEIWSRDTRHNPFAFPSSLHVLNLPVGRHLLLSSTNDAAS